MPNDNNKECVRVLSTVCHLRRFSQARSTGAWSPSLQPSQEFSFIYPHNPLHTSGKGFSHILEPAATKVTQFQNITEPLCLSYLNILAVLLGNLFTLLSISIGHCALLLIGGGALLLALWGTHLQHQADQYQTDRYALPIPVQRIQRIHI